MVLFKAIAIKQRKPFLNKDDRLDLLVIYSPLWEYVPNFSVTLTKLILPLLMKFEWFQQNIQVILKTFCSEFWKYMFLE